MCAMNRNCWLALVTVSAAAIGAVAGDVKGRVLDPAQSGLANATVSLKSVTDPTKTFSVLTDGNGWFRIAGVPAGKYELQAAARGFIAAQRPSVQIDSSGYTEIFVLRVADCHCEGPVTVDESPFERRPVAINDLYLASDISRFKLSSLR